MRQVKSQSLTVWSYNINTHSDDHTSDCGLERLARTDESTACNCSLLKGCSLPFDVSRRS